MPDTSNPQTRDAAVDGTKSRPRKVAGKSRRREFCWRTARRFRFPSEDDRRYGDVRIGRGKQECSEAGTEPQTLSDGKILLPWPLYSALVAKLDKVALPMDRYHDWLEHGVGCTIFTEVLFALKQADICGDRADRAEAALRALEPYPSMAPIEPVQIEKVLSEVGDIWPAWDFVADRSGATAAQ